MQMVAVPPGEAVPMEMEMMEVVRLGMVIMAEAWQVAASAVEMLEAWVAVARKVAGAAVDLKVVRVVAMATAAAAGAQMYAPLHLGQVP